MAVTAVAAIGSGALAATGAVAVSTLAWVAVGATVVGMITKNQNLMKIGGGIGLGAALGSLAGPSYGAEAVAADDVAAQKAAADSMAARQASDPQAWAAMSGASADAGAGAAGAVDLSATDLAGSGGYASAGAAPAPAQGIINAEAPTVASAAPTTTQAPDTAMPASSTGAGPTGQNPNAATDPNSIQAQNDAAVKGPTSGMSASEMGSGQYGGSSAGQTLKPPSNWFSEIWNGLSPTGKAGLVQVGGQALAGAAKGAADYADTSRKIAFAQDQRDYERRNLATMPQVGLKPAGLINTKMRGA